MWLDQTADDGLIPKFPPPSHLNETEFWGLKFFDATPFSSFLGLQISSYHPPILFMEDQIMVVLVQVESSRYTIDRLVYRLEDPTMGE